MVSLGAEGEVLDGLEGEGEGVGDEQLQLWGEGVGEQGRSPSYFFYSWSYSPLLPTCAHPCWSEAAASFGQLHHFSQYYRGGWGHWTIVVTCAFSE